MIQPGSGDMPTVAGPAGDRQTASPVGALLIQSGAYGSGTVSIASGATTSSSVGPTTGGRLAGLFVSSAFTGTSISFSVSADGVNFSPFKQNGVLVSLAVVANDYVDLLGTYPGLTACPYVRVVSNASESGARTLTYVTV